VQVPVEVETQPGVQPQQDPGPQVQLEWQPEGMLRVGGYVDSYSWPLFACCDRDADDRLDSIEAQNSIILLDGDDAREIFRRLDVDADGFLYWPEFDANYRDATKDGDSFYLRPIRKSQLKDLPGLEYDTETVALPVEDIVKRFDRDGDSSLNAVELGTLLSDSGLDPRLVDRMQPLDFDNSGSIDALELEEILKFIKLPSPKRVKLSPEYGEKPVTLLDLNGDGILDQEEFRRGLLALDPSLLAWERLIIAGIDSDQDQRISVEEFSILRTARK
jgi:Ca2+-binding EF-hand superfamily protein